METVDEDRLISSDWRPLQGTPVTLPPGRENPYLWKPKSGFGRWQRDMDWRHTSRRIEELLLRRLKEEA